jgi:hypothetical protein
MVCSHVGLYQPSAANTVFALDERRHPIAEATIFLADSNRV